MDLDFRQMKSLVVRLETRIVCLEESNTKYKEKNEEISKKLEKNVKNLAELNNKFQSFQQENLTLKAEVDFNNKKILGLEKSQIENKILIEKLEKQLSKNNKKTKEIQKDLPRIQKEVTCLKSLTEDLNKLRKVLNRSLVQVDEQSMTGSSLVGKLEQLSHIVNGLNTRVTEIEVNKKKTVKSFFHAKLLPQNQPLETVQWTPLDKCESFFSYYVHLSMDNGQFVANGDGIYQLCGRLVQKGDGHLAIGLEVEDIDFVFFLGDTHEHDDTCCGMVLLPLKSGQKVGMDVYRYKGADPRVGECDFMGCLVTPCDVGSLEDVIELQKKCFNL